MTSGPRDKIPFAMCDHLVQGLRLSQVGKFLCVRLAASQMTTSICKKQLYFWSLPCEVACGCNKSVEKHSKWTIKGLSAARVISWISALPLLFSPPTQRDHIYWVIKKKAWIVAAQRKAASQSTPRELRLPGLNPPCPSSSVSHLIIGHTLTYSILIPGTVALFRLGCPVVTVDRNLSQMFT